MLRLFPILFFLLVCTTAVGQEAQSFVQETHEALPFDDGGEARGVTWHPESGVWAAAASGIYRRNDAGWERITSDPAFALLATRSGVWYSTVSGVFRWQNGHSERLGDQPAAVLCEAAEGVYAIGPAGVWLSVGGLFTQKKGDLARSVRDALSDGNGGLWVATDVGLYHVSGRHSRHYHGPSYLISAAVRGLAFDARHRLWAGGLGGISLLRKDKKETALTDPFPSRQITCVRRAPDGTMWAGTDAGVVRFRNDGSHSLLFSRRWLLDDQVRALAFDDQGTAWVATVKGVSAIRRKTMTLAEKEAYFYDILMKRHIREPWIAGVCRLREPGNPASWMPEDDDNDGEYTGNYLAMECFRYAATRNPDAREKARKAFRFLTLLREVTGGDGFFARTLVPAQGWQGHVHDDNRTYTQSQRIEAFLRDPRFKPVEARWHLSEDKKWRWKGDTSSDEVCGHFMAYYFFYELVADENDRKEVRKQVSAIVDHLLRHDFNLTDTDGQHTRWGVWSPALLNHDPEWAPDRAQNSMELLAFLKLASHVTGEARYQDHYLRLLREEKYLENMARIPDQNPAWFIYFDVMLQAYVYPILIGCEKDPTLRRFYEQHMDAWMERRRKDENPLVNFFYSFTRRKPTEVKASVAFLKDTPLDLVNWEIDHSRREDVHLVRYPVLEDLQVVPLPPPSIRATVRWDKNPWQATAGHADIEREPVFWLLPYWMGRYLHLID